MLLAHCVVRAPVPSISVSFPFALKSSSPPILSSLSVPRSSNFSCFSSSTLIPLAMATDSGVSAAEYDKALDCLSSLIIRRTRADGNNKGDNFDIMTEYLKILELEERIAQLKVIHVAGTKGKGSTCSFTESILRACGLRTGLFISPHLIDVRERFVLDGVEISQEKFLKHFWWCWHRLQEKKSDDLPLPNYFRFLALLAFKIFSEEQVDVAILEVGLGGKFDATNVVQAPVVCGIASLGYDHMEILGYTLGEIAGEKAGIFKKGVPAYTVPQPEEAMTVLKEKASQLDVPLQVVSSLNPSLLKGQRLGLDGEHQYLNAGLAIALSTAWLQRTGNTGCISLDHNTIADQFVFGLSKASLQGRAQIVPDSLGAQGYNFGQKQLVFYLDGAHSPESLEVCAEWFSRVVNEDSQHLEQNVADYHTRQILLFNCMSVRDPLMLLPPLLSTCAKNGVKFYKALFVPNQSVFNKVFSGTQPLSDAEQVDLSWQLALQKVWENLIDNQKGTSDYDGSLVLPSIPSGIKWLRESIQQNKSIRYQVLVTGSLHLVGDVLRIIKK